MPDFWMVVAVVLVVAVIGIVIQSHRYRIPTEYGPGFFDRYGIEHRRRIPDPEVGAWQRVAMAGFWWLILPIDGLSGVLSGVEPGKIPLRSWWRSFVLGDTAPNSPPPPPKTVEQPQGGTAFLNGSGPLQEVGETTVPK